MRRLLVATVTAIVAGLAPWIGLAPAASADSPGTVLYAAQPGEFIAYARTIRLMDGTLLATFERTRSPVADGTIRRSTDDGRTWTTAATVRDPLTEPGHPTPRFWQPFLFELPRQVGEFPAGTILLVANLAGEADDTTFVLWHSLDKGSSWQFSSVVQRGRHSPNGIWEPFLDLNAQGQLVTYFADERRKTWWSQLIAHVVSNDGGRTWSAHPDGSKRYEPGLVGDVASGLRTDRPGMPTVATQPNGHKAMAYELCGEGGGPPRPCEVFVKTSTDGGATWGRDPGDLGTRPTTTDGRYLTNSPYIVSTTSGQLLLTGMRARLVNGSMAPEDTRLVMTAKTPGGPWHWLPAPIAVNYSAPTSSCYPNYSPHLLPSSDGASVRLTAPSAVSSTGCEERTGEAQAGVLPIRATFADDDRGWKTYGGCWSVRQGVYFEECGGTGGSKSLTGSTALGDVTVSAETVMVSPAANPGILLRVTDPHPGTDAHNGYFVGLTPSGIILGRQRHSWTHLATHPTTVPVGTWYRLTATARGCTFTITGAPADNPTATTTFTHTDPGCTTTGLAGVRNFNGPARYRNFSITS